MSGRTFGAATILLLITIATYAPGFKGAFLWDDNYWIEDNETLRTAAGLSKIWFVPGWTSQYYPLVYSSFWVEYHIWGLNTTGYVIVNTLLHGLNAVLLWLVLRRLAVPGAWLAAVLFAVHPVHVESVAWIQERKNVLSGLFFFATILAYLRFASIGPARQPQPVSPAGQQKHAPLWYFLALALTACALLSKTAVCGLPAVLALLLWWKRDHLSRRDWLRLLPFFALAFLLGSVTVWVEKNFVGAQGDEWNFSILERCLLAGRVLWFYPAKLVWPVNLSFIYPRWQLDSAAWPQYLYPLAAIAVVTSLWLLRGRLGKGPVVAVLYFAGMLAPTLGFINYYPMRFSFVADHFVYVPSAGLLALAAALVTRALSRLPSRSPLRPTLAAALPLVLLSLTWKHGQYFTDEVALWKNTLAKNPDCWLAHSTLAGIMNRKNEDRAAIEHAEAALRLNRDEVYAHYNLGVVLERNNALELAEKHLREAARLAPDSCPALLHLGGIRLKQGRLEEAAGYLVEEATMKPWSISALLMLAETRARQQDWHEACACLRKVCELAPRTPDYHTALANALDKIGAHTEAEAHRREARQIEN